MNTGLNGMGIKLQELDQQYIELKKEVQICQTGDLHEIRKEIIKKRDQVDKDYLLLQDRVNNSRSPVLQELSAIQLEALNALEDSLADHSLELDEATSLYAEHIIDFVIQSMRKSELIILCAAENTITTENRKEF